MTITSKDNHLVKQWRLLSADGRARRKQGLFACEGARLCMDAALSGIVIEAVLYTEKAASHYASQLDIVWNTAQTKAEISASLAQYMADTASPQGIFCICKMPQTTFSVTSLAPNGRYLALEDIQDPSNLGTVIRTAEALGFAGLLLSDGCCDVYNPKVLRGSMGGVFRLPCLWSGDFVHAIPALQQTGRRCLACVPDPEAVPVTAEKLDTAICFIGNEGNGLRPETIVACDGKVTIPMPGRAESLNAATAAGIVMWEQVRRGE
jgi:TrmH family RNA methyltransferase